MKPGQVAQLSASLCESRKALEGLGREAQASLDYLIAQCWWTGQSIPHGTPQNGRPLRPGALLGTETALRKLAHSATRMADQIARALPPKKIFQKKVGNPPKPCYVPHSEY